MEYPCLCRLLSSHTKAIHANVFEEKFKTVSNYGSDINFREKNSMENFS